VVTSPIISARDIVKTYGYGRNSLTVLGGVSLSIERGSVVSIMGPSGAGKSTLLNCLGCLDGFQQGRLEILGRDVSGLTVEELSGFRNRHLGFIFQLHNLLAEFNALENVMMPLLVGRMPWSKARQTASAILDRFGLSARLNHRPAELSGGECQRIAVARAIAAEPDIILADEPTGSLDRENSRNLASVLLELGRERGATVIIITHDREIAAMAERTISLVDGKIVDDIIVDIHGTEH
jgi:ABC-type lipoprotein export system ATPase subunit